MLETRFISSLTLLDGALPAQYGLHTAGVVDIQTRSGTYQPGGSLSVYGGSHATLTPSFDEGGTIGNTQFYVAGQLLTDNVGIENPTPDYDAIHDFTAQGKFFGYVSTLLGDGGRFSIISGTSVSSYEIPNSPGQTPVYTVDGSSDFNSSLLNENQVNGISTTSPLGRSQPVRSTRRSLFSRVIRHCISCPMRSETLSSTASPRMCSGIACQRPSGRCGLSSRSAHHPFRLRSERRIDGFDQ